MIYRHNWNSSNLAKIGTNTGNPTGITISGAYKQEAISEPITLPAGTYIFAIVLNAKIVDERNIIAILMQGDYNLVTWKFKGVGNNAYGNNTYSYSYIHTIHEPVSYKVAIGCNWITDTDNNYAEALLQAIKIV